MPTMRLSWTSTTGPHDKPYPPPGTFGPADFPSGAAAWTKAELAKAPPIGCVTMRWCSSATRRSETICPNLGPPPEGGNAFISRSAQWVKDQLTDHPPSDDCNPPYP